MLNFNQYVIQLAVERFISTPEGVEYIEKLRYIDLLIDKLENSTSDEEFNRLHDELYRLDKEEIASRKNIPIWCNVQEYLAK